uniref:Uncharacterized protein n=1 Tax=Trichogramma kaykai TaxID=54128 RepID=A0ABD2W6A2_9HYME
MVREVFAARGRKERCKEALDAVPGRLENIQQDVFKLFAEVTKDSVIVEVRSRADLDRLLGLEGCKESGLEVTERIASATWLRLAIFDVPNSFSEDKVLGALAGQNSDMLGNSSEAEIRALLKFKFKRGSKETGKTSCLVLEADPGIREVLIKAKRVYRSATNAKVFTIRPRHVVARPYAENVVGHTARKSAPKGRVKTSGHDV